MFWRRKTRIGRCDSGMKKRLQNLRPRQMVSEDVAELLLGLIQRKFYEGRAVDFAKDRRRLLQWVVFWPAVGFFKERAVSLPGQRYHELLSQILIEAAANQTGPIRYVPAWLGQTVQSHFAHHGDEIYEEAKSLRTLAEHSLTMLGRLPVKPTEDVVDRFAAAGAILATTKRAARPVKKGAVKEQLSLL
jgi:hypothetical protein